MMRFPVRTLRAGLLLILCSLLAACADERSLEQQIIAAVKEVEALVENGERGAFMKRIAEDFSAQQGTLDRDEFRRFMYLQMSQYRRMQAQIFPIRVRPAEAGEAIADFKALITGGGGLLPDSGALYQISTRWRFEGGEWLMTEAEWVMTRLEDT